MEITDLNGCPIEITDLEEAIKITAQYKDYKQEGKNLSNFNERQKAYWTDMHEKLTAIKSRLNNTLKF
ncbi:hypothetical protein B6A10_06435 [Flavobacterium sp. L1I52]|uniref:Uncharacterized protein n=1 Tax=Flavobacterium pokkalii TaxID=1940408 RepID=A0ABR7UQB2_9FLAO|nr:hypothetical protein [Flavobacterium pokkalii]MBD0724812.1 hypothetical protein [Flavobacterium pokkalii]